MFVVADSLGAHEMSKLLAHYTQHWFSDPSLGSSRSGVSFMVARCSDPGVRVQLCVARRDGASGCCTWRVVIDGSVFLALFISQITTRHTVYSLLLAQSLIDAWVCRPSKIKERSPQ